MSSKPPLIIERVVQNGREGPDMIGFPLTVGSDGESNARFWIGFPEGHNHGAFATRAGMLAVVNAILDVLAADADANEA